MTSHAPVVALEKPTGRRRRRWRTVGIIFLIVFVCLLASFCVGSPAYYSSKYASAGPARPRPFPGRAIPEKQTEPHTCGLHALASLYRAYDLDPDILRVRFRIGVDKPVSNFMPSSTGTIHPDMLRVLSQDGFDAEILRPGSSTTRQRLEAHLDDGHMAIALVRVKELHWVHIAGGVNDKLLICDSLHEESYLEPNDDYVRDRVYSLLLVKPRDPY